MTNILILYSSIDGHTIKICNRLKQVIERRANNATLVSVSDAHRIELESFDKIIVGASIRYGKHDRRIFEFINSNLLLLNSKPTAFFSVNIVARKVTKNSPETNPYVQKFLKGTAWKPLRLAVFAGKLDYPRYGFLDCLMIRFIMLITKGPTDPATVVEYTDWHYVEDFGRVICDM